MCYLIAKVILASASPRRKELLEQIGAEFVVCPAKGEEIITEEEPSAVVMELSRQKAEEVASGVLTYNEQHAELVTPQDILVIGADTVVAYENQILGKPKNEEDAKESIYDNIFGNIIVLLSAKIEFDAINDLDNEMSGMRRK